MGQDCDLSLFKFLCNAGKYLNDLKRCTILHSARLSLVSKHRQQQTSSENCAFAQKSHLKERKKEQTLDFKIN